MNHPDLERLTAWVHELLDLRGASEVEEHVARCAACETLAARVRAEGEVLARELATTDRLAALKADLLRRAARPARRPSRGLVWQAPIAAAVLVGLVAVLATPAPTHRITDGRVALEDGRELRAPAELAASGTWRVRAVEPARLRLSDRSTVELTPGTRLALEARGERGVLPEVSSGEAVFAVVRDARPLTVRSPAGRVESREGSFRVKTVRVDEGGAAMNGMLAGVIVTVFSGSLSLSNERGAAQAVPGQAAVLSLSEAPLFLASEQDHEQLLKRLEQLAAAIAKLEQEITRLEERNKQLKSQLNSGGRGGVFFGGGAAVPGAPGGATKRVVVQGEGLYVIEEEKKNEKKEK